MASVVMACIFVADVGVAMRLWPKCLWRTHGCAISSARIRCPCHTHRHVVMAYIVMAYIVMVYIVMVYIVMACIVMAYIGMAASGLHSVHRSTHKSTYRPVYAHVHTRVDTHS